MYMFFADVLAMMDDKGVYEFVIDCDPSNFNTYIIYRVYTHIIHIWTHINKTEEPCGKGLEIFTVGHIHKH